MNIIQRGEQFVQSLREQARKTVWDWRQCPFCRGTETCSWGSYVRRPWTLLGRQVVRVRRHRCRPCKRTYAELSPWLVRRSWYARDVHRYALDLWQHGGSSLRRVAEFARSLMGRQERWLLWHVLDQEPEEQERCHLAAATVQRWLDGAGRAAQKAVAGQLEGIATSGCVGADGLWARLRGQTKVVLLALVDNVTGLLWPPTVVDEEESEGSWKELFRQAVLSGLVLDDLRGVVSDGANGLIGCLQAMVKWANHQRCIWRKLGGEVTRRAAQAAQGLYGAAAKAARERVRRELVSPIHAVLDAKGFQEAELALVKLPAHELGAELARLLEGYLDAALLHLKAYNRGLMRVGPEWVWRDFRLRLSRGRNHGTGVRLQRAALVWAIYRNFEPAQWRSERKRHYRRPGQSPLDVAGAPPGPTTYLDALGV